MKYLVIALILVAAGGIIGWCLHPDPIMNIFDDPRGCVIQWDDGTVSYKSRTTHLGTLGPGESKTIHVSPLVTIDGRE